MPITQTLPQAFCRQCQRKVEVFIILDQGDEIINCTLCGTRLNIQIADVEGHKPGAGAGARPAPPRPGQGRPSEADDKFLDELTSAMEVPAEEPLLLEAIEADVYYDGALGAVLIADDEQLVRNVLGNVFTEQGVAKEVIHCVNGSDLIKKYSETLQKGRLPVGLLVLDLEMPLLNGIQTAMTVRKFEQAKGLMPVPILFFSGRKRDAKLDEAMKKLHPSMYMYKGGDSRGGSAEGALRERVRKVVGLLMREIQG